MAQFKQAYQIIDRNEGGYANDPADPGGETYRGIARKINPKWPGWVTIDFIKKRFGAIPYNAIIKTKWPGYQVVDNYYVVDFYQNKWNRSRAGEINNQKIANIYFDFYILHSRAVEAMQKALNYLGKRVVVDNLIGPQTLRAINSADPAKLYDAFKNKRYKYHKKRKNSKFYKGWIKRTDQFSSFVKDKKTTNTAKIIMAVIGVGILFLIKKEN